MERAGEAQQRKHLLKRSRIHSDRKSKHQTRIMWTTLPTDGMMRIQRHRSDPYTASQTNYRFRRRSQLRFSSSGLQTSTIALFSKSNLFHRTITPVCSTYLRH